MFKKKQQTVRDFDTMRRSTCGNCPAGCGVKVFLKNGEIVDIFGDEEHPVNKGSFCPKGMLSYFHGTSRNRITQCSIRASLAQPFQNVRWGEAIRALSKRISEISSTFGKESIYIHGSDSDPFDYLAGAAWFARHFDIANAPARFFPRPFGKGGIIDNMFGVPGSALLMNSPRDWCHSKCILLYNCDLAATDPMTLGPLLDARDRGTPLLTIDSATTMTSSRATLSLRVKPGSESLALKTILHLLIRKGMIDEEFIQESTEGFTSLKTELEKVSLETAAKDCWVDIKELERMADVIGRAYPIQVIAGSWHSRRHLSEVELFLCATLVCARGSIGIPGGGLNLLNASPFLWGSPDLKNSGNAGTSEEEESHFNFEEILLSTKNKIGALICRGNPCGRLADCKKTKAAMSEIPLLVHLSSYPNETFHHAHFSFPMSSWLEYSGVIATNNGRSVQWHHKTVEPPGECGSNLQFWTDLAASMDSDKPCPWRNGQGEVDSLKAAHFFLSNNPLTQAISAEDLDPEVNPPGGILWPCIDPSELDFEDSRLIQGNVRGKNILFRRSTNYPLSESRFPTTSGKINCAVALIRDKSSLAEPQKILYPLILITGTLIDSTDEFGHFVTDRGVGANSSGIKIHPQLARLICVNKGESLTLENGNGTLTAPAWLSDDIDPRTVWCPEGMDPYQPFLAYENPRGLFDLPSSGLASKAFAWVTAYKFRSEKEATTALIVRFVEQFQS